MMMKKIITTISIFMVSFVFSQNIKSLQESYSGEVSWNKANKTITFKSSGSIYFKNKTGVGKNPEKDHKNHFWKIPKRVKKIIINKNVTVKGAFHSFSDIKIYGEDRKSSIIFGTNLEAWADKNNPGKQDLKEWYYAQLQNFKGVMTIENLTILNPFSYFVRGFGPIIHVKSCDFIDNRQGHQNHSDGFCGGNGSTVDDSYFECGDDVFKTYFSYDVSNCTINMRDNAVPIQLGWGNYSNAAVCNFKNIKIFGNSGRGSSDNAVISGRKGKFNITINIDGLEVDNPNAVLVSLWDSRMTLNGTITNAKIKVNKYTKRRNSGTDNLIICGHKIHAEIYDCKIQ